MHDLSDRYSVYASHTEVFKPQPGYVKDFDGNTLPPETGTSTEIGAKAELASDLTASLALFRTLQDPYAEYVQETGSYVSREGLTSKGAELELTGEIAPGWQITGGYTYTTTKDKQGERAVLQIPRHSVKVFTTYRLGGAWEKLTLGGGVTWPSEIRSDMTTPAQAPYSLVSALARYDSTDNVSATLRVNNLLDKEYYTGLPAYGVWGAPRNVSLSLSARF